MNFNPMSKKQHEWRCPICKILHKGFTLDECRNQDCGKEKVISTKRRGRPPGSKNKPKDVK